MGIGSKRQVVGFTWEKTRPSVLASTRAKLSSVSSGKDNSPGVLTDKTFWDDRQDLMSLIFVLKWSAKFSQRSSVGVLKTLLKLVPVKILKVEKRNRGLFLWLVMSCEK